MAASPVRTECLDYFIVFSTRHLNNLMREYVKYCNFQRLHQGIDNLVLSDMAIMKTGEIKRSLFFSGFTAITTERLSSLFIHH